MIELETIYSTTLQSHAFDDSTKKSVEQKFFTLILWVFVYPFFNFEYFLILEVRKTLQR